MKIEGKKSTPVVVGQELVCLIDNPYSKEGEIHFPTNETLAFYSLLVGNGYFGFNN